MGTKGADFPKWLKLPETASVVSKGTNRDKEAYSGFDGTDLDHILRQLGVKRLFVAGLATDYCIKETVLDALNHGYQVIVVEDCIKGVDFPKGSEKKALEQMKQRGAQFVTSLDIFQGEAR